MPIRVAVIVLLALGSCAVVPPEEKPHHISQQRTPSWPAMCARGIRHFCAVEQEV